MIFYGIDKKKPQEVLYTERTLDNHRGKVVFIYFLRRLFLFDFGEFLSQNLYKEIMFFVC